MTMNSEDDLRPPRARPFEEEEELQPPMRNIQKGDVRNIAKDGSLLKSAIISLGVTILVIIALGVMGGGSFVTKKDFEQNWVNMQASVATSTADLSQLRTTVNNAVQGIPQSVQTQVTASVQQSVSSLSSQISELSSKIDSYNNTVSGMQSSIKDLEDKITDLEKLAEEEEEEDDGSSTTGAPIINSFNPVTGNTGSAIVISGDNFTGATGVAFGGTPSQGFTINSDTKITAIVGAGSTGNIVVTTPLGSTASTDIFTFGSTPTQTGVITPSWYNSPMYWATVPAGQSTRNFGLKVANGTGQTLTYVNVTLELQSSIALPDLASDPQLLSQYGSITWQYTPLTGNRMRFDGTGYMWVDAGNEWAELQNLTINVAIPPTGARTISVTKFVINSKTLQ